MLTHTTSPDLAVPDEKNDKLRSLIKAKAEEYLERAEKLKEHMAKAESKTPGKAAGAIGANGKVSSGGGKLV